tara:strand:+ start:211 stop:534 length:324 start_codon:yes stop_codon:yes gene_type:complete
MPFSSDDDFLESQYEFNCIGTGCQNMTNGSQYCAKTYCQTEIQDDTNVINFNIDNESQDDFENDYSLEETQIIINYCEFVELEDQSWTEYEQKSGYTRPYNWYVAKN